MYRSPTSTTTNQCIASIKYQIQPYDRNQLDKFYKLVFTNSKCYILDKYGQAIVEAQSENNLY